MAGDPREALALNPTPRPWVSATGTSLRACRAEPALGFRV